MGSVLVEMYFPWEIIFREIYTYMVYFAYIAMAVSVSPCVCALQSFVQVIP